MTEIGLRERKKARTRRVIADAAARLFAERGYEQVAVSDVAREADVSEQTVYNYFQTKEQLVTDRDQPHRPPDRARGVRPPGQRHRQRDQRYNRSHARDRQAAGNRARRRLPD